MDSIFALLPLFLLIVILFWGARVFRRNNGKEGPSATGLKPYGVHGFLALFVFASYYIAPFFVAGITSKGIRDAEQQTPALISMPEWGAYKVGTWLLVFAVIVWQIWVAKRLRNRFEPSSLRHARILCFASPWMIILGDVVLGKMTLGIEPQGAAVVEYMKSIIQGSIWGLYFIFSKRCKNTYVTEPGMGQKNSQASQEIKATANILDKSDTTLSFRPNPSTAMSAAAPAQDTHQLPGKSPTAATPHTASGADQRLSQLGKLRDSGLISTEEYAEKRQEIIDTL